MSPVRCLSVSAHDPEAAVIAQAAEAIRVGGLVAFPTETVYGLGANAWSATAVAKIFRAKGRPPSNPLIVHVADVAMAARVVAEWPPVAESLARAFWPGPLTLVLPRHPDIPALVSAGLPAVGVRVPAHPVARALIVAADCPIAAPSANPYMGVSPTQAAHVSRGMYDSPEEILLLDGGEAGVGLESTVLSLTGPTPLVLRPGGVSVERLREHLGEVLLLGSEASHQALPSPGLARRHYAPRASVSLYGSCQDIQTALDAALAEGERVGLLLHSCTVSGGGEVQVLPSEPEAYGRGLYASLHELDARGVRRILVESPPETLAWLAVHDRLKRAASAA